MDPSTRYLRSRSHGFSPRGRTRIALARHVVRGAVVRRRRPALLAHGSDDHATDDRWPSSKMPRGSPWRRARFGLVWPGARYEGLITVFLEYLAAFGGEILADDGRVVVDQPPAIEALTFMRRELEDRGVAPRSVLNWREEEVRLAFQNGDAAFMRNWPYAWTLLQDGQRSRVAGRVGVTPFPGTNVRQRTAALGGAQLAVNAYSAHPHLAWRLVSFLTAPEQMIERARLAAQLPARSSLYEQRRARRGAADTDCTDPGGARSGRAPAHHTCVQRAVRHSAGATASCAHRTAVARQRAQGRGQRDPPAAVTIGPDRER